MLLPILSMHRMVHPRRGPRRQSLLGVNILRGPQERGYDLPWTSSLDSTATQRRISQSAAKLHVISSAPATDAGLSTTPRVYGARTGSRMRGLSPTWLMRWATNSLNGASQIGLIGGPRPGLHGSRSLPQSAWPLPLRKRTKTS